MEVRIQAIHFDASEKLQDFIQKKTAKLEKYCDDINKVEVSLKVVKPETAMNKEAGIKAMSYSRAKPCLMTLFGVGEKVADCICLFSLHQLQAFPVDTHIRQVLDIHYKRGFPNRRYRGIQGVMQQYIFYYELEK